MIMMIMMIMICCFYFLLVVKSKCTWHVNACGEAEATSEANGPLLYTIIRLNALKPSCYQSLSCNFPIFFVPLWLKWRTRLWFWFTFRLWAAIMAAPPIPLIPDIASHTDPEFMPRKTKTPDFVTYVN